MLYDIDLPSPTAQQVECFDASSTINGSECEDSDPSIEDSIEACCVQSSGQFYRQTSGDPCQPCIGGLLIALESASLPSQPCILKSARRYSITLRYVRMCERG